MSNGEANDKYWSWLERGIIALLLSGILTWTITNANAITRVEAAQPKEIPPAWFKERVDRLEKKIDNLTQVITEHMVKHGKGD